MPNSAHRLGCSQKELGHELFRVLRCWRSQPYPDYSAFQPLVQLGLACVDVTAAELVMQEPQPRIVDDRDRQQAVWFLIKKAIITLRPRVSELAPGHADALRWMTQFGWPKGLQVPQEVYTYLVLHLAYVAKSHDDRQLAKLLDVALSAVAAIREAGMKALALRLSEWEEQWSEPRTGGGRGDISPGLQKQRANECSQRSECEDVQTLRDSVHALEGELEATQTNAREQIKKLAAQLTHAQSITNRAQRENEEITLRYQALKIGLRRWGLFALGAIATSLLVGLRPSLLYIPWLDLHKNAFWIQLQLEALFILALLNIPFGQHWAVWLSGIFTLATAIIATVIA